MEEMRGTGFAGSSPLFPSRERACHRAAVDVVTDVERDVHDSERRWFVFKILRGDTNGMGDDEVAATPALHAEAERTKKTEKRRGGYMVTSGVGSDKGPKPGDVARSRGDRTLVCIE